MRARKAWHNLGDIIPEEMFQFSNSLLYIPREPSKLRDLLRFAWGHPEALKRRGQEYKGEGVGAESGAVTGAKEGAGVGVGEGAKVRAGVGFKV